MVGQHARVKAVGTDRNYNETLVRIQKPTQGLKVETQIKAGKMTWVPGQW